MKINADIETTELTGINTGRTRFRVTCSCGEVVHEATTGPLSMLRSHLKDEHNIECSFEYKEP